MLPHEPGVRLSVGRPGAGKTFGIRVEVLQAARRFPVLVIDRVYEWRREPYSLVPPDIRVAYARTVERAREGFRAGYQLVIVNPDDTESAAEEACRWARRARGLCGVVVHEAHNAFPNGKRLSPYALDVATAWRHFQVALWLDTQRLALLNRTFDLADVIRLYACADADRKVIRDLGGPELEAAVLECGRRLAPRSEGGLGEPGWHVRLAGSRMPPYELVRERFGS